MKKCAQCKITNLPDDDGMICKWCVTKNRIANDEDITVRRPEFKDHTVRNAIFGVLAVALIIWLAMTSKNEPEATPAAAAETSAARQERTDKFAAYGMCCQFIKNQHDNAEDFHFVEGQDFGSSEWIITGTVKLYNEYGNQVPHRWTAQIRQEPNKMWHLVYPVVMN